MGYIAVFTRKPTATDNKTHVLPERVARDRFLNDICRRAKLPLIRFKTARRYDVETIRETVRSHLPKGACIVRPHDTLATDANGSPLGWTWSKVSA